MEYVQNGKTLSKKYDASFSFKRKGHQYVQNCYFKVANEKNFVEEFDEIQSDFNNSDGKKA